MNRDIFNIAINLREPRIWFFVIIFFTMLQSFINVLYCSHGFLFFPYNSFLFDSNDLHADLVKTGISLIKESNLVDFKNWNTTYQNFYLNNPYSKALDLIAYSHPTLYHLPPLPRLLTFINGCVILNISPTFLVSLFYIITIVSILLTTKLFFNDGDRNFIIYSFVILFSYPVLMILTRGHFYSLISGILTFIFVYNIFKRGNIVFVIILLALITNMRPNAFILASLFFIFGYKNGIKYSLVSAVISIVIFLVLFAITNYFDPLYTMSSFSSGLKIYYQQYVIGSGGDMFNNALLSVVKLPVVFSSKIFIAFNIDFIVSITNTIIFVLGLLTSIVGIILLSKNRITEFEFTFIIFLVYAMYSSVFASYYMFIFFVFLLIPFKLFEHSHSNSYKFILFISTVLLIPKNYIFIHNISLEVIVNPLVMLFAIFYIISSATKSVKLNLAESL